jgi:hypothetical protein
MNFDNYLFRASAIGKIISKSGKLTDGVKTYLEELFIGQLYDVQKEIGSKYFDKGISCEQDGLDLLSKTLFKGLFAGKNKEQFRNDYVQGTPDTLVKDNVFDIKNAYDLFTFGKASLSWDYEWQVRTYMWLTGKKNGFIFYCLNDMPDFLLVGEEKKLFYSGGYMSIESESYQNACAELRKRYLYDYMKPEERFKLFEIEYTPEHQDMIIESVVSSRKFLNQLLEQHSDRIKVNVSIIKNGLTS